MREFCCLSFSEVSALSYYTDRYYLLFYEQFPLAMMNAWASRNLFQI